jgi:L-glyceraldehyde 3-phosphate reductase
MAEPSEAITTGYVAAPDRYDAMPYRRVGTSRLRLPSISLGLWQNFGDDRALETQRARLGVEYDGWEAAVQADPN